MISLPLVKTREELRHASAGWRKAGERIALIPTMGALHEGHLAHLQVAKGKAERVVVSIFVNPTQFAPHEDFARYPRDLESDARKLRSAGGVDLIYAPSAAEIYPDGAAAVPVVDGPAAGLESDFRPHFFGGVTTVVERLFRHVEPDFATFGEKDYQQLQVVKRMTQQRGLTVEIVPVPIIREADGLALSSRNAYLSEEEREIAPALYRILQSVASRIHAGRGIAEAETEGAASLLSAGFRRVDYCSVRDAESLRPIRALTRPGRVLAAAWLGKTRLIDNIPV